MRRKKSRPDNTQIYRQLSELRQRGIMQTSLRLSEFKRIWEDKFPNSPMQSVIWLNDMKIYLKENKPAHVNFLGDDVESSSN